MNSPQPASGPAQRRNWTRRLVNVLVALVVAAVAAATFVFSYDGVHAIALLGGVSRQLARYYPGLFDAVLVIACIAAVMLRDGRWWARLWAWVVIFVLLAAIGTTDVLHAMNYTLRHRVTEGIVAAAPVVAVLLAFSLLLTLLRQSRTHPAEPAGPAPLELPALLPAVAAPIALPAALATAAAPTEPLPAALPAAESAAPAASAPTRDHPSLAGGVQPPPAAAEPGRPARRAAEQNGEITPAGPAPQAASAHGPDWDVPEWDAPNATTEVRAAGTATTNAGATDVPATGTAAADTAAGAPTAESPAEGVPATDARDADASGADARGAAAASMAAPTADGPPVNETPETAEPGEQAPPTVRIPALPPEPEPTAPARVRRAIRYAGGRVPPLAANQPAERPSSPVADYWETEEAGQFAGLVYPAREDPAGAENEAVPSDDAGDTPAGRPAPARTPPELDDDAPPFATAPFAAVPRLNRVRSTPAPPADEDE